MLELAPFVVALLAAVAAYMLVQLRRRFIAAQATLTAVFVVLTLGVAPFAGVHIALFGDVPAVRGWGDVLARAFIALAAGLAQAYLLLLSEPTGVAIARARPRLAVAGSVAAVLIGLGALTPSPAFGSGPLDSWTEVAVQCVFLVYVAVALSDVAHAAARWSRRSHGVLSTCLVLIALGSTSAIVYAVVKGSCVAVEAAGAVPPARAVEASRAAALLGLILVSTGCVLPAVDRGVRVVRRAVRTRLLLDRLYPLWADLVRTAPGIALEPILPRWRDRLRSRDLDVRLYRRVIEIRDGQLALRQRTRAIGPPDGRPELLKALVVDAPGGSSKGSDSPATVAEEIRWWTGVATAYERVMRQERRGART